MRPAVFVAALLGETALITWRVAAGGPAATDLAEYVGRYAPDSIQAQGIVAFRLREDVLTMAPSFWRPPRIMVAVGRDSFQLENFAERLAIFHRGSDGRVASVTVSGVGFSGTLRRLAPGDTAPAEHLEAGRPGAALRAFRVAGTDPKIQIEMAARASSVPTLVPAAAELLTALARERPHTAAVWVALGDARIAQHRKTEARACYRRALELEPKDEDAQSGLFRLGALPPSGDGGWRLPFTLDALFAPPTAAEIRAVKRSWADRDLGVHDVRELLRNRIALPGGDVDLIAMSHLVHGQRHVGVVIVPADAAPRSCPLLIEARGVNPSFTSLRVPEGLTSPGILGTERGRFVIAVPAFRGETLIVGADTLRAEGDPGDSWDGSTDDLIAFLGVTLQTVAAVDTSRIAVFGRSRGGTVAMLAGERDPRIRAVVAWAGPVDWFTAMGQQGWTVRDAVADGLRVRAGRRGPGGQFIATFLKSAVDGHADLRACRALMISSSPLLFAEQLPLTQVHYGVDDGIVPAENGRLLVKQMRSLGRGPDCFRAWFHDHAGHDQDLFVAPRESRRVMEQMAAGRSFQSRPCRIGP